MATLENRCVPTKPPSAAWPGQAWAFPEVAWQRPRYYWQGSPDGGRSSSRRSGGGAGIPSGSSLGTSTRLTLRQRVDDATCRAAAAGAMVRRQASKSRGRSRTRRTRAGVKKGK